MKNIYILHLSCKYLLGGWVTLRKWAFGQILTLNDHPPWIFCDDNPCYPPITTHISSSKAFRKTHRQQSPRLHSSQMKAKGVRQEGVIHARTRGGQGTWAYTPGSQGPILLLVWQRLRPLGIFLRVTAPVFLPWDTGHTGIFFLQNVHIGDAEINKTLELQESSNWSQMYT